MSQYRIKLKPQTGNIMHKTVRYPVKYKRVVTPPPMPPKLSTSDYALSVKSIQKKQKQARHNLQCAENIIAQELGTQIKSRKKKSKPGRFWEKSRIIQQDKG